MKDFPLTTHQGRKAQLPTTSHKDGFMVNTKNQGDTAHITEQTPKEGLMADLTLATSSPTNGVNSTNQPKRINKNTVQKYRLKFQGAERSLDSIEKKLEVIDKELAKDSITATRRKSLHSKRVKLLSTQDMKKVALQLAKQRIDFYYSHNTKIASRERMQNRKEGNIRVRVEKLTFSLRTFYKSVQLTTFERESLISAVQKDDQAALREVITNAINTHSSLKITLPEDGTSESTAVLKSMHKWFQSFPGIRNNQNNNSVADAA